MLNRVALCALTLLTACNASIVVYTQGTPHSVFDLFPRVTIPAAGYDYVSPINIPNCYLEDIYQIAEEFRDMPASFGNELPPDGLRGFLVVGSPRDGCTPIDPPPSVNKTIDNFTGKWIVLLSRYNCSFEVKVRNAQKAGYDCAIVHNVNSSDLETMSAKDPEGIIIPSVFVSDLAGLILAQEYVYTEGFYIMVNGDLPFNINTHLLLPFAIVVALCLVVMIIFMIVKCIKDRRRARRHRLPHRSLRKIPTCKFSKGDPYDTCAICLDDYQEGDRLRVLPCAHAYHAKCIDPWLTQNRRVCPVCKRRVLALGERRRPLSDSDSDDSREPLVASARDDDTNDTQGGTFVEQRENPFVRAARFMSRLRARADVTAQTDTRAQDYTSDVEYEPVGPTDSVADEESRPLVSQSFSDESRSRGGRRSRRTRSAGDTRPAPSRGSINTRGEIGVAALPNTTATITGDNRNVHL